MRVPKAPPEQIAMPGHYLVACVDLLGQSERSTSAKSLSRNDKWDEFVRISTFRFFHVGFSDSFIIGMPLQAVETPLDVEGLARSVTQLWDTLLGLAWLSLLALKQGIPVRIGVDAGLGLRCFQMRFSARCC